MLDVILYKLALPSFIFQIYVLIQCIVRCYTTDISTAGTHLLETRVGPDRIQAIFNIRPDIRQYNLLYFTTRIPVHKQSQALILKSLVLNSNNQVTLD